MSVYIKDDPDDLTLAFESIQKQTLLPQQFVLVCDGILTEQQDVIIKRFEEVFGGLCVSFYVHRLPFNVGLGQALAEGSKYCNQEYIVRMDSDDISRLDRIEKTRDLVSMHSDASVIGSDIEEFLYCPGDLSRIRKASKTEDIYRAGKFRNPLNHVTVCIKRDDLISVGGYESALYHEDYFLWVKFIVSGYKLVNVNEVFVDVRVGNDLVGRRQGYSYFLHELAFASRCQIAGYFSVFDKAIYLLPRIIVRLMPKSVLTRVYKILRERF